MKPIASTQRKLAKNLKLFRVHRGLTQEQLASEANLRQNYISDIERGVKNISLATLDRIATALECDVRQLLAPIEDLRLEKIQQRR